MSQYQHHLLSQGSKWEKILFEKNGYKIYECHKSGLRICKIVDSENHVSEVYSDEYFFEGKAGYPNYLNGKDHLYKYGKDYAQIISKYISPGKLLDAGSAAGFILKGFEDSGWQGEGIEPNNRMAEYGRNQLNLRITTGTFEKFESSQRFDLITMIQVIGHFYNIDEVLQNLKRLLNEKGYVLVESWNMKSIYARLMGKNWHEYSPPSVVRWFSDESLCNLFNLYGFELIAKGHPPKKINIKHALSLIEEKSFNFLFKKLIFAFLSKLFGKYNINYPPMDLKWYLFQKKSNKNKY